MNIQILKIIIWPKNKEKEKRIIDFHLGKVNIIHGASQTGKSALIPIIDYCLLSSRMTIPVGVIRDKSDWFGIVVKIDNSFVTIARNNIKGKDVYYKDSNEIHIPDHPIANDKVAALKNKLNNLFGIPFFEIDSNKQMPRPSFRDLISFNFQPQNIIANPNCLLYKTDLAEYRKRLQNIFNYAIGAETAEDLEKKHLKSKYEKELTVEKQKKADKEDFIKDELFKQQDLLLDAINLGLIKKDSVILNDEESIIENLKSLTTKTFSDISLSFDGRDDLAKKLIEVENNLTPLYSDLRELEQKRNSILEDIELTNKISNNLIIKKQRLNISQFIKTFCLENNKDSEVISDLNRMCEKLLILENEIRSVVPSENSLYEKKYVETNEQIQKLTKKINMELEYYRKLHDKTKQNSIFETFQISVGKAKNIIDLLDTDLPDIVDRIADLETKIKQCKTNPNPDAILKKITNIISDYLPKSAEFNKIDSFDQKDLTIKINVRDGETAYLSETGSGSNWVAYHLAVALGFQEYFLGLESFAFNFLIIDQPTQVYFPTAEYDDNTKQYIFNDNDRDISSVKEIFKILNNAIDKNNNNFQIIVMDHAGKNIWQDLKEVVEVAHWESNDGLIPNDWD